MNEKPTCPYMVSGLCYRNSGCIYIPSFDCMTKAELQRRIEYAKRIKALKNKRGNKK